MTYLIDDLIKIHEKEGKTKMNLLLQSEKAKHKKMFFTPVIKIGKYWYGWERWWGNNNKDTILKRKKVDNPIWNFIKYVPEISKNHDSWIKIKRLKYFKNL
jgi:hypothetical protein